MWPSPLILVHLFVSRCSNDKSLVKIHQQILENLWKHIVSDTWTDARTYVCKTYSLRRRRTLNKITCNTPRKQLYINCSIKKLKQNWMHMHVLYVMHIWETLAHIMFTRCLAARLSWRLLHVSFLPLISNMKSKQVRPQCRFALQQTHQLTDTIQYSYSTADITQYLHTYYSVNKQPS